MTFYKDLAERALKTFVQAFAAVFLPAVVAGLNGVTNLSTAKQLAVSAVVGGVAAGFSALTSLLSKGVGDKDTASLVKP